MSHLLRSNAYVGENNVCMRLCVCSIWFCMLHVAHEAYMCLERYYMYMYMHVHACGLCVNCTGV